MPVPQHAPLEDLAANSAVRLFEQRARQALASFVLNETNIEAVFHICHLVDGLPLALELAAAWVRAISCGEIAREIERGLGFLSSSARDLPERHRSIEAVFDHSWTLLRDEERSAFMKLSVFQGGFTRQAAEQVAGADLGVLLALVDKSLVRPSEIHAGRYELHELVQQYAAGKLEQDSGERHATLQRHCAYYLSLLAEKDAPLRSCCQREVLLELAGEIDNLRLAWDSAIAYGEIAALHGSAFALWYFYNLRDALQEGEAAFTRAAAAVRDRLEKPGPGAGAERAQLAGALGELLAHQAQFTFRQGRNQQAMSLYRTSIAILRPLNEPRALAQALTYSAVVSWITGEFEQAWPELYESQAISQEMGDEWAQAQSGNFMGMVAHAQGDFQRAYDLLSAALERTRSLGDARFISFAAGQLGRAAQALGKLDEVIDLLQESLLLTRETGDRLGIGMALEQLAATTQASGNPDEAQRLLQESISQFRDVGDLWFLAHALNLAGNFALQAGQNSQAREKFLEAGRLALAAQSPPNLLDALSGLACLEARMGRYERALELALKVLDHPASTQDARDRVSGLRHEIEPFLTAEQFKTAHLQSLSKTLDVFFEV